MFEDYLQDGYAFYELAEKEVAKKNEREAKRFYRAAVFCTASALESFVNFVGDTMKQGNVLDKIEIAFLNDKALELSPTTAKIQEKIKFSPIDGKVKYIIKKFRVEINISSAKEWTDFMDFKRLRDSLIHSKNITDEMTLAGYKKALKNGLNANIEIINKISIKIFSKPLRKNLLDLKV